MTGVIDAAVRKLTRLVVTFIAMIAVVPLLWMTLTAYVGRVSLEADGVVTGKHETILLGAGDGWLRVYEIAYRYRAPDVLTPEESSHNVDLGTYTRLHVGQPVRIHYLSSRVVRLWSGVGSYIEGTPSFARIRYGGIVGRALIAPSAALGAILLGLAALRTRSVSLGVTAAIVGGVAVPSALLLAFAFLIAPGLFWAWRRRGSIYGVMLLVAVAAMMAILYWRVPHPEPMPPGTQLRATAVVRQVRLVTEIWRGPDVGPAREGGESIGRPFQAVDLEFTPIGAIEAVHAVDSIDAGSVPGLAVSLHVPVSYSTTDPRVARMIGATRTYDRAAWLYLMALAGGFTLFVTFVIVPIAERFKQLGNRLRRVGVDGSGGGSANNGISL